MRKMDEKYSPHLSSKERNKLSRIAADPRVADTIRKRCRVLLAANKSNGQKTRIALAKEAGVNVSTVTNILDLYQEGGLEKVLVIQRNSNSDSANLKATPEVRAMIFKIKESDPPYGKSKWTQEDLARALRRQTGISLGKSTICRILQGQ